MKYVHLKFCWIFALQKRLHQFTNNESWAELPWTSYLSRASFLFTPVFMLFCFPVTFILETTPFLLSWNWSWSRYCPDSRNWAATIKQREHSGLGLECRPSLSLDQTAWQLIRAQLFLMSGLCLSVRLKAQRKPGTLWCHASLLYLCQQNILWSCDAQ